MAERKRKPATKKPAPKPKKSAPVKKPVKTTRAAAPKLPVKKTAAKLPLKKAAAKKKPAPVKKTVKKAAAAKKPSVTKKAAAKKPPLEAETAPASQPAAAPVHVLTGAPLLPRERSADPLRRQTPSRQSLPPTPLAPTPSSIVTPVAPVAALVVARPEPPRVDPTWGALPSAQKKPVGDFADFWSSPDPAPAAALSSRYSWSLSSPSSPSPSPSPPSSVPSSSSLQPGQSGLPGQPGLPGQGRRRRRRRRRRGGGFEGQPQSFGPDGQPLPQNGQQRQPQLPVDPIFRRLRRQFNLQNFRSGQEQVIRDLLAGRDVLAIMPTGAGKSLTYQLTAFELQGVTVVVSPLLALMSDQLIKLRRTGAVGARLDSTETVREKRATLERIEEGRHKIIYCTPERAASGALIKELGGQKVALFVVDEAHCVSEWGHDFRPAYLSLKQCVDKLTEAGATLNGKRPPVLALTATATPKVAEDIIAQLQLKDPDQVHTGFARPSLQFDVRYVNDLKQQVRRLLRLIRRIKGSGIVYCSTVRDVEALNGALPHLGLRVGLYHGKLTTKEREEQQRAFMRNNPRIMIATNAFGLGVDKPDIRFVMHYHLPGSIEQYYQEAGRAGRDGKPSRCVLLYNPNDEEVQEFFVGGKYPNKSEFNKVAFGLSAGDGNLKEIAMNSGVSQQKSRVVLGVLKDHGFADEDGSVFRLLGTPDKDTLGRAAEEYRKRREADRGKLEAMIRYARSTRCRVKMLLEYFGEKDVPLCHRCDNCQKYGAEADKEKTVDLMSPIEIEEMEEDREAIPDIPEPPPPPRKDPTHHF